MLLASAYFGYFAFEFRLDEVVLSQFVDEAVVTSDLMEQCKVSYCAQIIEH